MKTRNHLEFFFVSFTETHAAEYAAEMVYKSDRTVRKWRSDLVSNNGILPESMQGLYQWTGVLWSNEDLNSKVTQYIRNFFAVNGRPNDNTLHPMTTKLSAPLW